MTSLNLIAINQLDNFLCSQDVASTGQPAWLLAYCSDAVRWGRVEDKKLILAAGQTLDASKVQTAHLFGDLAEIRIWRKENGFAYCQLLDIGEEEDRLDECYMLWGTKSKLLDNDFSEVSDGVQGLTHTVPVTITFPENNSKRLLHLHVRHYIGYKHDQAYVTHSRLINLVVAD